MSYLDTVSLEFHLDKDGRLRFEDLGEVLGKEQGLLPHPEWHRKAIVLAENRKLIPGAISVLALSLAYKIMLLTPTENHVMRAAAFYFDSDENVWALSASGFDASGWTRHLWEWVPSDVGFDKDPGWPVMLAKVCEKHGLGKAILTDTMGNPWTGL